MKNIFAFLKPLTEDEKRLRAYNKLPNQAVLRGRGQWNDLFHLGVRDPNNWQALCGRKMVEKKPYEETRETVQAALDRGVKDYCPECLGKFMPANAE